ncbi:hypothetical protein NIIDNTM18_38810 [Mycolicibacterium litorale]|uniref:DUF222 domain-containing protein n=1 Tax=Mycolicibacterium litorale TaxID=758802 RepID=A0A6S6P436_9MYCO|nr:hypothetical protein NIIDNTM18_38810 [Mycolicibacterium litorale]
MLVSVPGPSIESMFDGSLPEIGGMRTLTDRELITAAAGWGRAENAAAARKLAAMAELFRRRTGCDDATDRHHWFVDPEASAVSELAAAQNITESLAMFQTHRAVMLADRLPQVGALFTAGLISDQLVRTIVGRTALITDPTLMAAVDADLATQIATWGPKSANKTTAAIDAIVETHDPAARRRVKDAENERDVQFGFLSDAAGFMTLWARMYAPDGAALEQRVTDLAHSVCPDDPRTADERRNDALAAIATGTPIRCECDNPDCPTTSNSQPTKDVTIHIVTTDHTLTHAQNNPTAAEARTISRRLGRSRAGARKAHARNGMPTPAAPHPNPTTDPQPRSKNSSAAATSPAASPAATNPPTPPTSTTPSPTPTDPPARPTSKPSAENTTSSKPSGPAPPAGPTTNSPTAPSCGPPPAATPTPPTPAAPCCSPPCAPPPHPHPNHPPPNQTRTAASTCPNAATPAPKTAPAASTPNANSTTTSPPNATNPHPSDGCDDIRRPAGSAPVWMTKRPSKT